MAYNYARVQNRADQLIRKYGRAAVLRRTSGDRPVRAVLIDYTTRERAGDLIQASDQKALVSAKGLTVPPDNEEDVLVIGAGPTFVAPFEELKIVAPPSKLDPAGTVVYWELQVRHG